MPAQTVTLTDELAASETTAFILVTPQQAFTDVDGKSHGKTVRTDYDTPDATPTLSAPVVASDAAGNVPSPVLYTIRRVLGSSTTTWKDVYLAASDGTVPLGQLETQPGVNPVTVARVLSVNGQGPDADGNVQIDAATNAALAAETAARQQADTANVQAIAAETLRAVGVEDAHANASDPHPVYLTAAEGNAAYGPVVASDNWLKAWAANVDNLIRSTTITRDANEAATGASVIWPDGSPGTYTATTVSTAFPGAVDAYQVTYGSPVTKTVTQPAVTRDSAGAVTNRPALTVA